MLLKPELTLTKKKKPNSNKLNLLVYISPVFLNEDGFITSQIYFSKLADTFIIISVILQILTIGVLIGFVAVLIKLIKALAEKVESLSDDVLDLKTKAEPLIENTAKFLNTANRVADSIDNNMDTLTNTVNSVKDSVKKVTDLVDTTREKITPPIMETVASYNGIVKGIKVFIEAIKDRAQKYHSEHKGSLVDVDFDVDIDYTNRTKRTQPESSSEYSELDNINAELNELRRKIQQD